VNIGLLFLKRGDLVKGRAYLKQAYAEGNKAAAEYMVMHNLIQSEREIEVEMLLPDEDPASAYNTDNTTRNRQGDIGSASKQVEDMTWSTKREGVRAQQTQSVKPFDKR